MGGHTGEGRFTGEWGPYRKMGAVQGDEGVYRGVGKDTSFDFIPKGKTQSR